eukprot:4027700-Pleurochrysis_carterae.AAC.4
MRLMPVARTLRTPCCTTREKGSSVIWTFVVREGHRAVRPVAQHARRQRAETLPVLAFTQRLRTQVSDAAGEAQAERERAAARGGGAALEAWSRGKTRGLRSCAGDWMEALRRALTQQGTPPLLMLLRADGDFIGDVCALERCVASR